MRLVIYVMLSHFFRMFINSGQTYYRILLMDKKPDDGLNPSTGSGQANKAENKMEGEDLDAAPVEAAQAASASGDAPTSKTEQKTSDAKPAEKESLFSRIRHWRFLYLALFAVLLVIVGASVATAVLLSKNTQKDIKTQDLTAEQLAELAGSSTIVGDPGQILNIQSSTIFESQVLARGDLSVAGTLKVGGPLNLPSLDAGAGTFDELTVDNNLSVAGNLTLQGSITVSGATSFKDLSVGQLSATTLQIAGDLSFGRHLTSGGSTPSKSNGSALGGGGTASVSGNDTAGTIAINTGSSPPAGCFVTINFVNKYNDTPAVIISPVGSASGSLDYYVNRSSTNFSVCTSNAPAAGTNYNFDYLVVN